MLTAGPILNFVKKAAGELLLRLKLLPTPKMGSKVK